MKKDKTGTAAGATTIRQSFDIEAEFNLYLERMGLADKAMPAIQYRMLKDAFYGAISQYLAWFQDDAYQLPEETVIEGVQKTWQQCKIHWAAKGVDIN